MLANGSCLPVRSARRRATVTISDPLAFKASRISSLEENFPVPTSSRELNSRPAIFNFDGLSDISENIANFQSLASSCALKIAGAQHPELLCVRGPLPQAI